MLRKSLLALATTALFTGCSSSSDAVPFDVANFTGSYSGTWTNTTFSSTGAASVTITDSGGDPMVAVDLDGNVFGGADPASESFTGMANLNDATLASTTSPVYGDVVSTLNGNGTITITGTNIPGGVDTFTLVGTIVNGQIQANVTITFDAGGSAAAVATLNIT